MSHITKIETSKDGILYFVHPQTGRACVNMRSLINFLTDEKFHNRISIMLSSSWNMFDQCGRLKNFEESEKLKFHCPVADRNIRSTKWGDLDGAVRFVKTIHMYLQSTLPEDGALRSAIELIQSLKPELKSSSRVGAVNLPSSRDAIAEVKVKPTYTVENTLRMRVDCLTYELSQAKITEKALRERIGELTQIMSRNESVMENANNRIEELELLVTNLSDASMPSSHGNVFFNKEDFLAACGEVGIAREYAEKHMMEEACSAISERILSTARVHINNSGYRKTGEECLNSWGLRRLKELDLTKFAVKVYTDLQKKKLNKNF